MDRSRWRTVARWKWIAGLAVLAAVLFASPFVPFGEWIGRFTTWIEGQGAWGMVLFAGGYVIATLLFFPGSLMSIASGVAFGLFWGTLIALTSATVGACLAFLIGRYLARDVFQQWAADYETFQALDSAIGQNDWKVIALLRLSPLVPFNLSNYFFGLTRARFWAYALSSFVGMFPGALLYVYLGHVGKATLTEGRSPRSTQEIVFLTLGLLATIGVAWYLTRLANQELAKRRKG